MLPKRSPIAIALGLGVMLVPPTAHADPQSGGTARVALRADMLGTEPGVKRDAITDNVLHHVMEALVAYDGEISPQPMLAESWEISDEGTTYTFNLRDGLTFHNGEPLTSAEVKWSWERWLDPETGFACTNWYDGSDGFAIESIKTPDEDTVVFNLNKPNALFLDQMANLQCLTAIVHPDSVDENGNWQRPVGTGPFVLSDWDKGKSIRLERFEDYQTADGARSGYAGSRKAWLNAVEFVIVPETTTALAGLQSGDLDLVYQLQPTDKAEIGDASRVQIHQGPSLEWNVLLIQTEDPVMSDRAMRRAIAHAIDFPLLADSASGSIVGYNPSTVPESSAYHGPAHDIGYERDLDKVAELLAAAGYDGETLTIQTNRRYNNMYQNAVIAQAMLREAGIETELDVLEWPAHLDNYFEGEFQLSAFGYSARTDPVLNYRAVLGDKSENSALQWENEKAVALINKAARIGQFEARQNIFDQVHRMMIKEVPTLNLYNHFSIDATSTRLKGYDVWPAGKPRLWGVWIEE